MTPVSASRRRCRPASNGAAAAIDRDPEDAGISPLGWYDVRYALHEAPDRCPRMHELAHAVASSRSALTRQMNRLDKAGFVT